MRGFIKGKSLSNSPNSRILAALSMPASYPGCSAPLIPLASGLDGLLLLAREFGETV